MKALLPAVALLQEPPNSVPPETTSAMDTDTALSLDGAKEEPDDLHQKHTYNYGYKPIFTCSFSHNQAIFLNKVSFKS